MADNRKKSIDKSEGPNVTKPNKILILINPHSGQGKSTQIFSKKFLPLLKDRGVDFEVFITRQDERVSDFIKKKSLEELERFTSIVVVSGDGLFHELLNSLMMRADHERAMSLPLGVVPTGSGNGLAYTLARRHQPNMRNKDDVIKFCCEQSLSEETCLADLVKLSYGATKLWSFLSIGWGILSDIDIDSEWLRILGEMRFTLYALLRSVTASSYHGSLSYKPIEGLSISNSATNGKNQLSTSLTPKNHLSNESRLRITDELSEGWIHIEDKFACLYAVHQASISSSTRFAPQSTLTDQIIYLTYIRGKLNPYRAIEFFLAMEDGKHDALPYVTVVPVREFMFQPLEPSRVVVDGELIPWKIGDGQIHVEIVPKALKLLAKP